MGHFDVVIPFGELRAKGWHYRNVASLFLAIFLETSFAATDGRPIWGSVLFGGHGFYTSIKLPHIEVYAVNTTTGVESTHVFSQSNGTFVIPHLPAGSYQLCWKNAPAGLVQSGCVQDPKAIEDTGKVPQYRGKAVWFDIPADSNTTVVTGRIKWANGVRALMDNQPVCRYSEPFFGTDLTARAQLMNANGNVIVLAPIHADTDGSYVLISPAPLTGTYVVRASCESSHSDKSVTLSGAGTVVADANLPTNHAPQIDQLAAMRRGHALAGAPLDKTLLVSVTASDAEGDALTYQWRATAGTVTGDNTPNVRWKLPRLGKGLHFLYVQVSDGKGGYQSQRLTISTDRGFVRAPAEQSAAPLPADSQPEFERFLGFKGLDTRLSACEYYRSLKAVESCAADGTPTGGITFAQWKAHNGMKGSSRTRVTRGEFKAAYRNVADLNLVRDQHGKKVGPDHIAYYVCNHADAVSNRPTRNLVACVATEYSAIPGVNGGRPFTQFYSFGPGGDLLLSINLDNRGEKFTPGNCVACHGGDTYFHRFPDHGATASDADIGGYFLPYDLDNFEFDTDRKFRRQNQEASLRQLNLLIRDTKPTPVTIQLLDGWYPKDAGPQQGDFVPPGWRHATDPNTIPDFADQLYLKVVKPACRLCHVAMSNDLGVDFNRYNARVTDDPSTPPDDHNGSFVGRFSDGGTAFAAEATYHEVCASDSNVDGYNQSMPNALQTYNRFWNDAEKLQLMEAFFEHENIARNNGQPPADDLCAKPPNP